MVDANGVVKSPQEKAAAELAAMKGVVDALAGMDGAAIARVLCWAAEQYAVPAPRAGRVASGVAARDGDMESQLVEPPNSSAADLFAATAPRTGPERALVAAYWFQVNCGQSEFDAKSLNDELKHLGHGLSNVTATLSSLMSHRPHLVIQTRKFGRGAQARKRYKLTHEGVRVVRAMIDASADQSNGNQ